MGMFKVAAAIVPSNPAMKLLASASLLDQASSPEGGKAFLLRVQFASLCVVQQPAQIERTTSLHANFGVECGSTAWGGKIARSINW